MKRLTELLIERLREAERERVRELRESGVQLGKNPAKVKIEMKNRAWPHGPYFEH